MKIISHVSSLFLFVLLFTFSLTVFAAPPPPPTPADPLIKNIKIVNLDDFGVKGDDNVFNADVSMDGRYVAFQSASTDLVPDDTNGTDDIFVRDTEMGTIEIVSKNIGGDVGDANSGSPSISSDGRYVAFASSAANLIMDDTNGVTDIFVYDRDTDTIERVSVNNEGDEGNQYSMSDPSISLDGRYVVFSSNATNFVEGAIPGIYDGDTNNQIDIFVYDRDMDTIERANVNGEEGNGQSSYPSVSSDGRYVAFYSNATNLVAGDTNGASDIFVYDRDTDTIERVSVNDEGESNGGSDYPSISSDGRYVAFSSNADNLILGDTNETGDIFVYDRDEDTISRVSVSISSGEGNGRSYQSSMSADARYIVFYSEATNLVSDDTNTFTDIFLRDREFGLTTLMTTDNQGNQTNSNSSSPVISPDGSTVVFASYATNLVDGDASDVQFDLFRAFTDTVVTVDSYDITDDAATTRGEIITLADHVSYGEYGVAYSSDGEEVLGDESLYEMYSSSPIMEGALFAVDISDLECETIYHYKAFLGTEGPRLYANNTESFTTAECGEEEDTTPPPSSSNNSSTSEEREQVRKSWDEHYGNETVTENTAPVDTSLLVNRLTRRGDRGAHVVQLQTILNTLGYTLTPDGIFGPITESAVKDFQTKHNLTPDGIVGPMTIGELVK